MPQEIVTSTPVGRELLNFMDEGPRAAAQIDVTPVLDPAVAQDGAKHEEARGLVQS